MFKKPIVRWLSVLLIVIAVIGVTFVGAKEPAPKTTGLVLEDMPIVLPANATEVEKTAAKELQHYLREITGSASSMITESVPVESGIYLGATKFAKENNVTYTDKNGMGEGWAIKAVGNSLVITGGEARGTLYGVYHLLEDELGVHWWNMWEEYVPEMESAVLPLDYDYSGEPVFADRGVYSNESLSTLYYVRNRQNGWTSNAPVAFGDEENFARPYHVHIFNRYYPPFYTAPTSASSAVWTEAINPDAVDWFVEHPEWFSWSDARQERISYGQLCLSNDELAADLGQKMIKAIELSYEDADKAGKKRPTYISVTPNDLGGLCECDECDASTAAHGESGHLLRFVNKIADIIDDVYPEIKVETLAYWQYFEVPLDDTLPADNVVIRLASSDVNVQRDLDHPTNAKVKDRLYAWADRLNKSDVPGEYDCPQLWYWDYAVNYSENGVFINHFKFFNDYRHLADVGAFGSFTECQSINTVDFWDLKHWLLSKAQEDPYQDELELTMTFLNGYYGEDAAQYLFDYLVKMDELNEASTIAYDFSDDFIEAPWLSVDDVKWGNAQFEAAIAATEANNDLTKDEKELFINRIQVARGGLDRQILANYNRYLQEAAANAEGDPEKILGIGQRETGLRMVAAYVWLCNMELEDDYTGIQNPGKRGDLGGNITSIYSQYRGETDQVTGDPIDRPAIPEQIFIDHPGIDEDHIFDFTNSTFWDASYHFGHAWVGDVNDASFEGGTSVVIDQGIYAREKGSVYSYYVFSESSPFKASFKPNWYLGDPIINDGEWHLYRAEDVIVLPEGSDRITFYDESLRFEVKDMDQIVGKPVDVYVSMKVKGDPSGTDPNNYARIYVDRVIVVEDCTCYDIDYTKSIPATCERGEILIGMCPVCGKEAQKEVAGTKLPHTFTGKNVYDAETNTYSNNCSVCGEVVYDDFYGELPEEALAVMEEKGATLDMVHDYAARDFGTAGITEQVADPDSDLGKASRYDVNRTSSLGHFKIDNNRGIYTWHNKIPTSQVPKADDIITDGEYHIYRMEGVDLFAGDTSVIYLFDWSFQLNISELEHLKGKTADVLLSFKCEGELNYDTAGKMPVYYIDRVIIIEDCADHVADSYEYDEANKVYVGTCHTCGKEIISSYPVSLLEDIGAGKTNASHIKDYDATIFNLSGLEVVADADANNGKAVYCAGKFGGGDIVFSFVNGGEFLRFKGAELSANDGKGYKFYKLDDVVVPTLASGDLGYMWSFGWLVQLRNLHGDFNAKMGYTLDIYMSFKVEGSDIYIDRFIVVDNCENHVNLEGAAKISSATCYKGEVYEATCSVCNTVKEMELKETKLPHKFGAYTYDPVTGTQTATCTNAGCGAVNTVSALPQVVTDRLAEKGIGVEHVLTLTAEDLVPAGTNFTVADDPESFNGKAAYCDSNVLGNPNSIHIAQDVKFSFNSQSTPWFSVPVAELTANSGAGYKVYAFEDLVVPNTDGSVYLYSFNHHVQSRAILNFLRQIEGRNVDVYVSMKVTGKFNWSKPYGAYWIDRIMFVDSCENYDLEYKAPEGTTCADTNIIYTALCPICGAEFTKDGGATAGHSFTKYVAAERSDTVFHAECDFGCGTIDTKVVEKKTWREQLPEELPENVKGHVIMAYRVPDFYMSGVDDSKRIDLDTGRVVAVRQYDPDLSSATQYALNIRNGFPCALYKPGYPTEGLGTFRYAENGKDFMGNADDGQYHLYAVKGKIPLVYENYNYIYFFSDWVMQCQMLDDDLLLAGYKGKKVDIYLYMKVEGDPSCGGANKPAYYVDQIIVASACEQDESWTVTKEPTCSEAGEAVGTCKICGQENAVVPIEALLHTIERPYIVSQPTCKAEAQEYGKCTVCGTWVEKQPVPGSMLEHSFSNYVLQEDGVTEIAYCDNGCGERHVRNAVSTGSNLDLPENIQQILPVLGKPASHGVSFSDIKSSDWYFDAVKEAVDNKLINGVTPTEFRPNETLTVAQAVKLASAYHEMNYTGDVTLENGSGNWYSSYVDYAVENGIIDSKYASKSTAEMNKPIDRSEFVSIFVKAMDDASLTGYNTVADNAIPDVKADDANADAIYKFYRAGILTGSDAKGTFNPHSSIKRSEVATILSRMYNENVRQAITLN